MSVIATTTTCSTCAAAAAGGVNIFANRGFSFGGSSVVAATAVVIVGGHNGDWRDLSSRRWICSLASSPDGSLCAHAGGIIHSSHWSCCGVRSRSGPCTRQLGTRRTLCQAGHVLIYSTTSHITCDVCNRSSSGGGGGGAEHGRCDACDFDCCETCSRLPPACELGVLGELLSP